MAWIDQPLLTAQGTSYYTVDAAATLILGQPAAKSVGTWAIQIVANGATFSLTFKARVRGSGLTGANLLGVPYQYLQDGTAIDKLANVAVTDANPGIFYVRCDFLELAIVVASVSVANPTIYVLGGPG